MKQAFLFKIIGDTLESIGFKAKGNVWIREGKEVSERVALQKSLYGRVYYFRPSYILNDLEVTNRYNGHALMATGLSSVEFRQLESYCNLENDKTDTEVEEQLPFLLKKAFSGKRIESKQAFKDYLIKSGTFVTKNVLDYLRIENIPPKVRPYVFFDDEGNQVIFENVIGNSDDISFDVYIDGDLCSTRHCCRETYIDLREMCDYIYRQLFINHFDVRELFSLHWSTDDDMLSVSLSANAEKEAYLQIYLFHEGEKREKRIRINSANFSDITKELDHVNTESPVHKEE